MPEPGIEVIQLVRREDFLLEAFCGLASVNRFVTLGSLESEDVAPSLSRDSSVNCPERFPVSGAHLPADGHLGGRNLKRPLD